MGSRYYRVWVSDGEPTAANPDGGYRTADAAERAIRFYPKDGRDTWQPGHTISIALVIE